MLAARRASGPFRQPSSRLGPEAHLATAGEQAAARPGRLQLAAGRSAEPSTTAELHLQAHAAARLNGCAGHVAKQEADLQSQPEARAVLGLAGRRVRCGMFCLCRQLSSAVMAKSKNHTAHNQTYKAHRHSIKKPKKTTYVSRKGVS